MNSMYKDAKTLIEYNHFDILTSEEKIGLFFATFNSLHRWKRIWLLVKSNEVEYTQRAICEMLPFPVILDNRIVIEEELHANATIVVSSETKKEDYFVEKTLEVFIQDGLSVFREKIKDEFFPMKNIENYLELLTIDDVSYRRKVYSKWNEEIYKVYMNETTEMDPPLEFGNLCFYNLLTVLETAKDTPTREQIKQIEAGESICFSLESKKHLKDVVKRVYPLLSEVGKKEL